MQEFVNFFSAIFVCFFNCQRWPIWFLNIATVLIGKACVEWLLPREPFCAACESSPECILATGNGERERNWQTSSEQLHIAHLELIFKRPIFIWYKSIQLHRLCLVGSFPKVLCRWRQKVCMSEAVSMSQCPAFTPWNCVLQDGWRCFWVLSVCFNFLPVGDRYFAGRFYLSAWAEPGKFLSGEYGLSWVHCQWHIWSCWSGDMGPSKLWLSFHSFCELS